MAIPDESTGDGIERTRLAFDELASSIVATIDHRSDESLRVKQALPFLKIDSAVYDEAGRRATIRSVDVSVEDGTPNLVLDLAYENLTIGDDRDIGLDDTLRIGVVIAPRHTGRTDHTIPFGFSKREPRRLVAAEPREPVALESDPDRRCYLLTRRKEPKVVVETERFERLREPSIVIPPEDLIVSDDELPLASPLDLDGAGGDEPAESPLELDGAGGDDPFESPLKLDGAGGEEPAESPLELDGELDWAPLSIGGRARALARFVWETVLRGEQTGQR